MNDVSQSVTKWGDQVWTFVATYGLAVAGGLVILIVGWKVSIWAADATDRVLGRSAKIDTTLRRFLASLVRYVILAFTGLAMLDRLGIQTASFIAVFGAAGLAIGLALQGTLTNIAAGVMLMLFRPFKVGDRVEIGGQTGTVRAIDLFVTELATDDNAQILMPNSKIWGDSIINHSYHAKRRVDVSLAIENSKDMARAIEIAKRVAQQAANIATEPPPAVATSEVAGRAVTVLVSVWCPTEKLREVKFALIQDLRQALDAAGL
ncbi:MAG: mechanosensitive ion channel [Alphaproteobacteria bacterium]